MPREGEPHRNTAVSAPEVPDLIARLVEIAKLIEEHEVALWQLRHEQQQLRAELGGVATGYKAGERQDDLPL